MTNQTIQLQSIDHVPAIQASEVREGDVRMFNFGSTSLVVKVIEKTEKTLALITYSEGKYYITDIRKTSLVAIVKRDQDVSEHRPTQAIYGRKGLVDVSEYFLVEEVKEEIAATNETVEEVEETPVNKIEVKEITFLWSESSVVANNTTVKTFSEAESIIFEIACNKETGGYDKTAFKITWEDGNTYTGRIDVLSRYTSGKELKKHIEDHCTFFAGLRKSYHETMEEYENTLRAYGITEEDKKEYQLFLDTYMLEDVKKEQIEEVQENTVQNEVIETQSENTIVVSAEITFQTGTGSKGNGIEITFTSKPSEEVRNAIKATGYRWAGKQRSNVWWAILNDSTLAIAEQLAGKQETTNNSEQTENTYEYPEINIDDNESYTISQKIQDAEHDANWIFRSSKRDHNKELQEILISYTNKVKNVIALTDNPYYIYKLKLGLQRFKKSYHETYVKWLSAKASQPSWAVTGRGNLNVSRYNKAMSRQDALLTELVNIPKELDKYINKYRNKIKHDQETIFKQAIEQTEINIDFKIETKEFSYMGYQEKKRVHVYKEYFIAKLWGCFRLFRNGKELNINLKTTDNLQTAKKALIHFIKQSEQIAS